MPTPYTFHLIAPSGYCINQSAAEQAIDFLQQHHNVTHHEVITRRDQRFAGDDYQRLADLNNLVDLPTLPDIILAVRGGYGASRLLPNIDYAGLQQRLHGTDTIVCGHSDFTAIQLALLTQCELVTFSGPMLSGNFGVEPPSDFTLQHFWGAITEPNYQLSWQDNTMMEGEWQGQLWGGNLAMICSLIGTPWMPKIKDGILVIEDINEHPFRIERMLLQLHYAGILQQQRAIITGSFSQGATSDYDAGYSLDTVWRYIETLTGVPIISQLAFGHEFDTVTLPIGAMAQLTAQQKQRQLKLSGYPILT